MTKALHNDRSVISLNKTKCLSWVTSGKQVHNEIQQLAVTVTSLITVHKRGFKTDSLSHLLVVKIEAPAFAVPSEIEKVLITHISCLSPKFNDREKVPWIKNLKFVRVEHYHKHSVVYGTLITAMKKLLKKSSRASYWHSGAYFYTALHHCFQARSTWPLFQETCAYHSSNAFIVLCNQARFHWVLLKTCVQLCCHKKEHSAL